MEPSKEPISVRIARINSEIVGKTTKLGTSVLNRDILLDVLQALYEECCLDNLQKYDENIAQFVEKYKKAIKEVKQLRVNITDFEIKNVIGRGHFGEVHLVKEKQTGDVYAMKTLRKFDNDIKNASFEEERNIMALASSHWLTSLQYAFQDSTYLFFIMEYHAGGDLLGLLYRQGGTLPESAATFYIAELVLALEDLHNMGFVHRDIKPDNVLLDRCGHIKLADFGSAAKLNKNGLVIISPPVGTPDYIAPEVLECADNKNKTAGYGVCCDFWSLGILAYELTIGNTPFTGQNSISIYSKILNHNNSLKFPSDATLSQAYVNFIKGLLTDTQIRMNSKQIRRHDLFKNLHFDTLRDQAPPYVPKITSVDDTSNFNDIQSRQKNPSIESFKKRTHFSGRNLPFVGFTFTHDSSTYDGNFDRKILAKDEVVESLKSEVEILRSKLVKNENFDQERDILVKKLDEKTRKLESMESLRDRLERELANNIAECAALKRTLELERKDRSELERKALDLIKSAKLKWEMAEKNKVEALFLQLDQQKEKISQLTMTNNILNEQLQHALKLEGKQKESLDTVQDLSRRSVIGLESRLERITSETQSAITELQRKLGEESHQKVILEGKVGKLKERETSLTNQLQQSQKDYDDLKVKIDNAEKIIKGLDEQVTILERDVEEIDTFKKEIARLQEIVDKSHKTVKDLENRNTLLQMEVKVLDGYKEEIDNMTKTITSMQNDKRVAQLESQLYEEKEKCQALKKQLQESENILTENQELKELRTKYWRMEKDFGNCKIDKRILERELKDAQAEIKQLKEKVEGFNETMTESRKAHESALLELSHINESISMELIKVKDTNSNLQDKLNNEKEKSDEEKVVINELKDIIKSKDQKINALHLETSTLKKEKTVVDNEIQQYIREKYDLQNSIERLQKEKNEVSNELDKSKREMQNTNLNLGALREACTLLESQVIEYEKIISSFEAKQCELNSNTEKLIQDLCQAKQDIQEAKKLTNEEKSLKLLGETKIKRLTEDVQCLQNECSSYKQQCMEYKQYSTNLSEELTVAEEKISDLEVTLKSSERQIGDLKSENRAIKEELSANITNMNKLRESNYKLNRQLDDLKSDKIVLSQRLNELETLLYENNNFYKERDLKAESTIKQQIKLIDYLQTMVDEPNNKKRTLSEVIFGSMKKENPPPKSLAMNYKDLESQLLKERQTNKQLHEEIYKLKAATSINDNINLLDKLNVKVERHKSEILSPKTKIAMEQIVNSPSKQKNDLYRQNSVQRMHHNIPHRYDSKLCTKTLLKCTGCSQLISLGRTMNVCKECNMVAHTHCTLPNTCGLPQIFAKHYKDSLEPKHEEAVTANPKNSITNIEGWIKVPGKIKGWEKRYACLTNSSINIYMSPPTEKATSLIQNFPLQPENSHGKVILEPSPTEIGIPVANSDLPFILKVEVAPDTTCWPQKCFIFMTLSAQEKDKWFLALQKIFYDDLDEKSKFDHVFNTPEGLNQFNINCLMELTENIKVIGTDKGLYSYYERTLLQIDGLTTVHHMSMVPATSTVLMIVNSNNTLISCDLNHLINLAQCAACTKPKLKYNDIDINNLNGFHILQVSHLSNQQQVCVATSKQLIILNYDLATNELKPLRILDTAEPTSCALFTENSLIVGANKFFEIDLATFQAEEFLDVSDNKLKQAVKCYKMGSFPLAIMQVSKNPKEYLLCFNEFSVFVDEYGRSSRNTELKSTHLPLAFQFIRPYLYVIQFVAIEIIKISEDTCDTSNESGASIETFRVELEKFRYIGSNKKGIYICQGNEIKFVNAKKIIDIDSSSIVSDSTENESDRFSFTSSIVQSLDENLSDAESIIDDGRQRRVKFSQTNL